MPVTTFTELLAQAEEGGYAVGYFECWSVESLLAVADAADECDSPVMLGFSGIQLPKPGRAVKDPLEVWAQAGLAVCRQMKSPACLVFNESPSEDWVNQAIELGFQMVMFADETLPREQQILHVARAVERAHAAGIGVEGEATAVEGVGGELDHRPDATHLTSASDAAAFVERTGVDALAVNVGQAHLHGRTFVDVDVKRVAELRRCVRVPLVLHGASSVRPASIEAAIEAGIRKINVGSVLKQDYFEALRQAAVAAGDSYNPYEVIGSGIEQDCLTAGRLALQRRVRKMIQLFGSAGKAWVPDRRGTLAR